MFPKDKKTYKHLNINTLTGETFDSIPKENGKYIFYCDTNDNDKCYLYRYENQQWNLKQPQNCYCIIKNDRIIFDNIQELQWNLIVNSYSYGAFFF